MYVPKIHRMVTIRHTHPKGFEAAASYVLCQQPGITRVTLDREMVTCNRCNYLTKHFGDKCMIPQPSLTSGDAQ